MDLSITDGRESSDDPIPAGEVELEELCRLEHLVVNHDLDPSLAVLCVLVEPNEDPDVSDEVRDEEELKKQLQDIVELSDLLDVQEPRSQLSNHVVYEVLVGEQLGHFQEPEENKVGVVQREGNRTQQVDPEVELDVVPSDVEGFLKLFDSILLDDFEEVEDDVWAFDDHEVKKCVVLVHKFHLPLWLVEVVAHHETTDGEIYI